MEGMIDSGGNLQESIATTISCIEVKMNSTEDE